MQESQSKKKRKHKGGVKKLKERIQGNTVYSIGFRSEHKDKDNEEKEREREHNAEIARPPPSRARPLFN